MIINNVSYEITIEGNGEPIVLLHGFTSNLHTWDELTKKLCPSYKVIRLDIIGHGNSDSPSNIEEYAIERQAEVIKEILDKLDLKKVSILGYSMGGRLAITFACMYPNMVSRLILESTTAGIENEADRVIRRNNDELLARKIDEEGIESFVDYWENISLFASLKKLPSEALANMREQRLANNKIGLINSLRMMGTGSQPSWWNEIQKFEFPVLIIVGEKDEKFCLIGKKLQNTIKNAKIELICGAGHIIHVEKPQIFGTIIEEFLNKTRIND